jgi:membrane protease YdiL (CAAX protease family)
MTMAENTHENPSAKRSSTLRLIIGLVIAYSPSYINILLRWAGVNWQFLQGPASVLLWNWLAVAALLFFIMKVENAGPSSIGLKRPNRGDLFWAICFWMISTIASGMLNAIWPPAQSSGMATVLALPFLVLVALIVTTSTTEEILFRGYPVERLRELTGSIWPAMLISFTLFVLPHVQFFGPQWLLYNGVGVILFYVLYAWRRNLWSCMLMHFLGNSLLLIPALGLAG